MSEALVIYQNVQTPVAYCKDVGEMMFESGMYGVKNAAEGFIIAYNAMAANLSLERYNSIYHTINGKKVMQADYMHAEFLRIGGRLTWKKSTRTECTGVFAHGKYAPDGFELTITLDEIPKALKNKDVWRNWPARMLQCRVISMGIKSIAPIINHGCYSEAEQEAYEKPVQATAEVVKEYPTTNGRYDHKTAPLVEKEYIESGGKTEEPLAAKCINIVKTASGKTVVNNPNPNPPPPPKPVTEKLSKVAADAIKWAEEMFIPEAQTKLEGYVGLKMKSELPVPAIMWKKEEKNILRNLKTYVTGIINEDGEIDEAAQQEAIEKALGIPPKESEDG